MVNRMCNDYRLEVEAAAIFEDFADFDRNGNCRVDVKAVFDNGAHLISRSVNACLADGHTVSIRR
jgi:hypothetical protein